MKNKIISAMLVGMSATMAVPATAVFAADETESSAVEEVAAETPAVEETAEPTESVDEDASEEVSAQEAEAEMVGYASDEAQKVADTPTDFTTKLSSITFSADTFGKYGEQLTSFVTGEEIDKSSLYNTEMAVIEKVQKIAIDESTEAVRAMKYAIALVFENTYGEDAFQPGRDIRRAILSDMGNDKDYEFAVSETVAAADAIYKENGGIITNPKDLLIAEPEKELYEYVMGMQDFEMNQGDKIQAPEVSFDEAYIKSVDIDTSAVDKDTAGVYKIVYIITGVNGNTMNVEKQCTVKAVEKPSDTTKELYEYVMGMEDLQIKVGEDIPQPNLAYDTTYIKSVDIDTSAVDNTKAGTYKIIFSITGTDGRTAVVEKQCTVIEDGEEPAPEKSLSEYVENIDDIEMQIGADIPLPTVSFDGEHVASVSIDTSKVNKDEAGTYPITYIITGVDGTEERVEKECRVVEDASLEELRTSMCAKIDELGVDKFTESDFQEKWDREAEAAKAQIKSLTTEEEMQAVVDKFTDTTNSIIGEQQLFVAKQGYVNILKKYHASFSYETNAQKQMADDTMAAAIEKINKATTVDEASNALDAGKESIRRIGEQDSDFVDELREKARKELNKTKDSIKDPTTIVCNVYNSLVARLDACKSAKEIESLMNSAGFAFSDAQKVVGGDLAAVSSVLKDLKGISGDGDTTATIEKIVALGTPKTVDEAESRVSDTWKALTCDVKQYVKYLTGRAGKNVTGKTKAEAYANYIELTGGTAQPDEKLAAAKESAKSDIDKLLAEIKSSDESISAKKEEVKAKAYELIDNAASVDEVDSALEKAKNMVSELSNEISKSEELTKAKETAKAAIQETVDSQTDETLKAEIYKLAESAIERIETAETADEITEIHNTFTKDVKTTIAAYEQDAALATAKAEALRKLSELENSAKSEYKSTEMDEIASKARTDIAAATSADDCANIYTNAKKEYKGAYLKSMRAVYSAKLDGLVSTDKFTDANYLAKAKEVIEKQKSNLEQATNEDTMEKCYNLAKDSIDKLLTAQSSAASLTQIKTDAINQLKNKYTNLTDQQTKVLNKYIDAINNATSADDVNKFVTQADAAMKDAGATSNGSTNGTTDTALADAKKNAIESLTNMVNNSELSDTQKAAAQQVLQTYIDKINAATTTDEVSKLLEAGKAELSKYGADANKAVPNSETKTTLGSGSGSGDASQKGDSTATSGVKTGDNNMGIIAIAGAAIMTALGAAYVSLRKFIKK